MQDMCSAHSYLSREGIFLLYVGIFLLPEDGTMMRNITVQTIDTALFLFSD
jgi:hypothetical protein